MRGLMLNKPSATGRLATRPARTPCGLKPVHRPVLLRAAAEEASISNSTETPVTATVDFDELTDIIKMVNDTDIIELELKSKKFNLNLKKREAIQAEQQLQFGPATYAPPPPAAAPTAPQPGPAVPSPPTPAPEPMASSAPKIDGIEITSPMSGTYYKAPAPGEAPFVKEGDRVSKGQTVGIIEAMKLMNEIEAEISGEVVKLLADNGTSVVPGMPLILIKP